MTIAFRFQLFGEVHAILLYYINNTLLRKFDKVLKKSGFCSQTFLMYICLIIRHWARTPRNKFTDRDTPRRRSVSNRATFQLPGKSHVAEDAYGYGFVKHSPGAG